MKGYNGRSIDEYWTPERMNESAARSRAERGITFESQLDQLSREFSYMCRSKTKPVKRKTINTEKAKQKTDVTKDDSTVSLDAPNISSAGMNDVDIAGEVTSIESTDFGE